MEWGVLSGVGTHARVAAPGGTHLRQPFVRLASRLAAGEPVLVDRRETIFERTITNSRIASMPYLLKLTQARRRTRRASYDPRRLSQPQNFDTIPEIGITAFDFDNCRRHWLLYDIAVSLSVLRSDRNGSNWSNGFWKATVAFVRFPGDPGSLRLLAAPAIALRLLRSILQFRVGPRPDQTTTLRVFRDRFILGDVW
mgnify:CR=1 FL=1